MKYLGFIFSFLCLFAVGKNHSETPSIVLGYDKLCWKGNSKHLIAEVSAVPITCEQGKNCAVFDKMIPLGQKASYKLNFSEISSKSGLSADKTILVAAICNDSNRNNRCDRNEKPVYQVLRLGGKYLKTLYPEGYLVLDFHPVTNAPDYCRSSM